jgi:DNA-3-methyladenine glycosylase II
MIEQFSEKDFKSICDGLAKKDKDLRSIITAHGHPPMWTRPAIFQTLILIILEQQVSLASAYAAFKKLKQHIKLVTPLRLLRLTDEELRACYFSRHKIGYARALATAIQSGELNLKKLSLGGDDEIRLELKKIKGIGDWSVDVYLMHALQRSDLFPLGDVALVNSLRTIKKLPTGITKEEMLLIADNWRPHRTIAAMILWHAYICRKGIKIQDDQFFLKK